VAIGAVKWQLVTSGYWTVTAEVASSSLVVPAILFKHLWKVWLSSVGTKRNIKQIHLPPPAAAV
jgi:hypothetical protein